jgi:regulatory protein
MRGKTQRPRAQRPPLEAEELRSLALAYVARYLTSEGKLTQYLRRKLRERGWAGEGDPPIAETVARCSQLGFVDDPAFATAKTASLSRRGYGRTRIRAALKAAGIDDGVIEQANQSDDDKALEIALIFARRRRIGAYSTKAATPELRRKWIAAIINAGHSYDLARSLAYQDPPEE